jgi:hypothetical protein
VFVPSGTFNFVEIGEPWITVDIPAGINLTGAIAPKDSNDQVIAYQTVLQIPYDVPGDDSIGIPTWFRITGSANPAVTSRFSYIELKGYRSINPTSTQQQIGLEIWQIMNFRVDHCWFLDCNGGGMSCFVEDSYQNTPNVCGVIDHCIFNNTNGIPEPYADRTVGYGIQVGRGAACTQWDNNSSNILGHYNAYSIFIENCFFANWRHCVSNGYGGHYVFRHNIVDGDFGFGSVDAHGTFAYVGSRATEVYDNTFMNPQSGWGKTVMYLRGGAGIFFNNTVIGYTTFIQMVNEGTVAKCWPHDVYIWSNNLVNVPNPVVTDAQVLGVDYFLSSMPNYQPYAYPFPSVL